MTNDVNDLWLGRMQQELGVLSSNLMLVNLQRDALENKVLADAELIQALKARCQQAEQANAELKAQIQPEIPVRRGHRKQFIPYSGEGNGAHQTQST